MNLTWSKRINPNWNPNSLVSQWDEISPDMTLPPGQIYTYPPPKESSTLAQIMQKGVTHWSSKWVINERGGGEAGIAAFRADAAYAKREYNDIPRTREIFGLNPVCMATNPEDGSCIWYSWWPNGFYNDEQAREKGRNVDIHCRLWVGETEEGDDYVPEGHGMWKAFYQELKARYQAQMAADGIPYYLCHNYFLRFGNNLYSLEHGDNTQAQKEAIYAEPNTSNQSVWKPSLYTPGGNLSDTNTILTDIYMDNPNKQAYEAYQALYAMDVSRMLGYHTGLCVFNRQEWLPGFASRFHLDAGKGAHPHQDVPAGTFQRSDKAPVDPNLLLTLPFLAREFGNIYTNWGAKVKASANPRAIFYYNQVHQGKDTWMPDSGGTAGYPGYISPGSENGRRSSEQEAYLNDLAHMGNVNWNTVAGPVAGGQFGYCDFRLDGGTWINKTPHKSDVVAAYYQKRGFVRYRVKGNQLLIMYWNGFGDNQKRLLEIRDPFNSNLIHTATVCGNGEHSVRITI